MQPVEGSLDGALVLASDGTIVRLVDPVTRLVCNAVMLTPAGRRVTMQVSASQDEGVLDVVDQGPGIPPLEQAVVLDRLSRTAAARAGQVPGVGLGLTTARSLVEAHGGRLTILASSAAGTVFQVSLALSPSTDGHPRDPGVGSVAGVGSVRRPVASDDLVIATRAGLGPLVAGEFSTWAADVALPASCTDFLEALLTGGRADALAVAHEAPGERGSTADLVVDVVQRALDEAGRRCQIGDLTVGDVNLATATTQYVLHVLQEEQPRSADRRSVAVVTGVVNERYDVGAGIVAGTLHAEGWDVRFLGTDVPHDAVLAAIDRHGADLVALSVTMNVHVPDAHDLIDRIRRSGPTRPGSSWAGPPSSATPSSG